MKKTNIRYDFSLLVDLLNLKGDYEILLEDNKISVPKNRRYLDTSTAEWCVSNISTLNRKTKALNRVIEICKEFLTLTEKNNNMVFVIEQG